MRRHPFGDSFEALIGAKRVAFAGEHAGRILALALESEHAGRIREGARDIFLQKETQDLALVFITRQRHLADLVPDRDSAVNLVRISLSRIFTTYSGCAYNSKVFGHCSNSFEGHRTEFGIFRRDQLSKPGAARPDAANKAFETLSDWRLTRDARLPRNAEVKVAQRRGNLRQYRSAPVVRWVAGRGGLHRRWGRSGWAAD